MSYIFSVQQLNLMTQNCQNLKLSPSQSIKKSKTIIKEYFVCFCGKSYSSFASIYLHSKKLHQILLNRQHNKKTTNKWSGNIKNIFYEFLQQQLFESSKSWQTQEIKKSNFQNCMFLKKESYVLNHSHSSRSESFLTETPMHQKLRHIFQQYFQASGQNSEQNILQTYLKFLMKNYSKLTTNTKYEQFCKEGSLNFIPHVMNQFVLSFQLMEEEIDKKMIGELAKFSDYLYSNGYCDFLSIQNQKYPKQYPINTYLQQG